MWFTDLKRSVKYGQCFRGQYLRNKANSFESPSIPLLHVNKTRVRILDDGAGVRKAKCAGKDKHSCTWQAGISRRCRGENAPQLGERLDGTPSSISRPKFEARRAEAAWASAARPGERGFSGLGAAGAGVRGQPGSAAAARSAPRDETSRRPAGWPRAV